MEIKTDIQEVEQDKTCTCKYTYELTTNKWILKIHCGKHKWTVREYNNYGGTTIVNE